MTPSDQKISTWRGRPIAELTREELIAALETMAEMYQQLLAEKQHEREVLLGPHR